MLTTDAIEQGNSGLRDRRFLPLRVRLRRRVLDREIAAGLRPDEDPARSLRAHQLRCVWERRCVAAALSNILQAADERHADPASRLELNDAEVLAARHQLVELIESLRSEKAVAPRGVALARQLADAGTSPLLRARAGFTVRQAVSEAIRAL